MRDLGDLDEFLTGELAPGLKLAVHGREYVVPPVRAAVGIWCQRMVDASARLRRSEEKSRPMIQAEIDRILEQLPEGVGFDAWILGDELFQRMVDDGVDLHRIRFVSQAVMVWTTGGDDAVEAFWRSGGGRPEAPRPANRAERRHQRTTGTSGVAGSVTPKQGSTSGTSRRRRR